MSQLKDLIIIGVGGHARVVIDAAELAGYNIIGLIDLDYKGQKEEIISHQVLGDFRVLNNYSVKSTDVFIAIGKGEKRAEYYNKVLSMRYNIPPIIHPATILSKYVKIGKGVFINAGTIINAKVVIGDNSVVNTGVILDHEVYIGDHSHVGPGCKIAGRVSIGDYTFIGIGSSVIDKIKIGSHVMIGAGSVVIKDIESNCTVAGVPARKIK